MQELLPLISFYGHGFVGVIYTILAGWVWHKSRSQNKRQLALLIALSVTALWGYTVSTTAADHPYALFSESLRNLAWLGFMFVLLRSGAGRDQPKTINLIYIVLTGMMLLLPAVDMFVWAVQPDYIFAGFFLKSMITLRMLFVIGGLVLVHNLYTVSAPEARWGIALPMAAIAAMWMFDLNLYTIGYLTGNFSRDLADTRGVAMVLLSPIFVMALKRNSNWRLRLSRSVTFQSVSLLAIGGYLVVMLLLSTILEFFGGTYVRLAQISLIFAMSVAALLIMPSGRFKAWLNVMIAKHFFQHRYDYRNEWMRFADTIGFPHADAAPFHERVVKSLGDIFGSTSGLLFTPDDDKHLALQAQWNWSTLELPSNVVTPQTMSFFESTGHVAVMDDVQNGTDERCDPRAIPQWLFDEKQAWVIVPLMHFGELAGLAVLGRPPLNRTLDWEDFDLLRVVSRQLASYLAEASSHQTLAEVQQFEQFNRRFAFVMHDIKNLVSQLSILTRNAEKHADKPDFRADMIETLRGSVGKMNELLARLSQHNKGKQAEPINVDLSKIVQQTADTKRLVYPVETDLPQGLMAKADPARVDTIINHLLQNAIEASPDGAPVMISGRQQSDYIAITITDKGVGMSESFMASKLFKPFESSKEGGFGIGAYEARALANSMHGQLRVQSRLGKGTSFNLMLPLADNNTQAPDDDVIFKKAM